MKASELTSTEQEQSELQLPSVGSFEKLDYFGRLGISPDASLSDAKKAYRVLALQYHPDKHKSSPDDASVIFRLLTDAYKVLSNPKEAAAYKNLYKNGLGNGLADQFKYARSPTIYYKNQQELHSDTHTTAISNNYVARMLGWQGVCLFFGRTGEVFKLYTRPIPSSYSGTLYYSATISEEDNELLAKESSGDVDVFDIETGKLKRTYEKVDRFANAGGGNILRIDENKSIIFARKSLVELLRDGTVNTISYLDDSANSISLSSNKQFILISYGERRAVDIFDLRQKQKVVRICTGFPVYTAEMSPDSRFIAYCGYSKSVSLYDSATNDITEIAVSCNEVHTLQFSPNGKFLVIAEYDNSRILYYSIQDREIKHIQNLNHNRNGFICQIYFTTNNRLVVNHYHAVYNIALPEILLGNIDVIEQEEIEQRLLANGEVKLDEDFRTITVIPPLANILVDDFKSVMSEHRSFLKDKTYRAMETLVSDKEQKCERLITYKELTGAVEKAGDAECKKRLSSTHATPATTDSTKIIEKTKTLLSSQGIQQIIFTESQPQLALKYSPEDKKNEVTSVPEAASIRAADQPETEFQIYVKTFTGETVAIDGVKPSDLVREVKDKIRQKVDVPNGADFIIVLAGKFLDSERTLSDLNITSETCLHAVLRQPSAAINEEKHERTDNIYTWRSYFSSFFNKFVPAQPTLSEEDKSFQTNFFTHYSPGCFGGHWNYFRRNSLTKQNALSYAAAHPESATDNALKAMKIKR